MTRQGIIDVALAIMRDQGLQTVTMRRIAAALDTGSASLYVYVRDTEDLHAQIFDALLGSVSAPAAGEGTWRERLKALLTSYQGLLVEHSDIARMVLSTQPSGPNFLSLVDTMLALLHEGGVADREASWGVDLLLLYPTAIAAERSARRSPGQRAAELSALAVEVERADAARYPHVARLGAELLSGPASARFDWGLEVLFSGILSTSRSPRTTGMTIKQLSIAIVGGDSEAPAHCLPRSRVDYIRRAPELCAHGRLPATHAVHWQLTLL